jgi:type VI secretion system protein VasG
MVIVPYFPVRDENLKRIVRLKLNKIARRMQEVHRLVMDYDDAVVDSVAARCTEVESGARNVDNILTNTLLPEVSKLLLEQMVAGRKPSRLDIRIGDDGLLTYQTDAAGEHAAAVTS